ncbi:hypothetical protein IMSAGC008_02089 [Muribaculaceae bacterium]|nr:hypothetical protein IMSAGC008_02089 [Muribaculaceae bacterium]
MLINTTITKITNVLILILFYTILLLKFPHACISIYPTDNIRIIIKILLALFVFEVHRLFCPIGKIITNWSYDTIANSIA